MSANRPSLLLGFVGEVLLDVIAAPRETNTKTTTIQIDARLGGAPINSAVVASQLSSDIASYPICSLGDDWIGDYLLNELRKYRTRLDMVSQIPDRDTSVAFYPVDSQREQSWSIYHRDADLEILSETWSKAFLQQLDGIAFGAPTLAHFQTTLRLKTILEAIEDSCLVLLDANYRAAMWNNPASYASTVLDWIPRVDIIKCNQFEAELLAGVNGDAKKVLRSLVVSDRQLVYMTLGSRGSVACYNNNIVMIPTAPIDGSPIGAGDAFTAGLLAGFALTSKTRKTKDALYDHVVAIGKFANNCGGIANLHSGACSIDVTSKYEQAYNNSLQMLIE